VHVVISTRVDPPLPLARFRVHGQMLELRADDLRFSLEETKLFLCGMELELDDSDIQTLMTRTEGWIAGLQLAALSLHDCKDHEALRQFIASFTGTNRYVLNYLAEEILARMPEDMRTFLLATSILGRMNASLCDAVTGQHNGEIMLARLDRANLFLMTMNEQGTWYCYHHLFVDLLRYRLSQLGEQEVCELHRRASLWFEREQTMDLAVEHALAAKDWERSARLIEQEGFSIWLNGQMEKLYAWLERLNGQIELHRYPLTTFLLAIIYLYKGQNGKYQQALMSTRDYWQRMQDERMLGHIYILQAYEALFNGDGAQAIEHTRKILAQSQSISWQGMPHVFQGAGYLLQGNTCQASVELMLGQRIGQQYKQTMTIISAAFYLGEMHYMQGQLEKALRFYQQCVNDVGGRMVWYQVQAYFRIGNIYREWNNLGLAGEYLQQGIALSGGYIHERIIIDGDILAAQIAYLQDPRGGNEQTMSLLERAERSAFQVGQRVHSAYIAHLSVRYLLDAGKLEAALSWVGCLQPSTREHMSLLEREQWDQIQVRLLLAQGKAAPAIHILLQLLPDVKRQERVTTELSLQLLLVHAYTISHETRLARRHFEYSVRLAVTGKFRRIFLDEKCVCADLLGEFYHRQQRRLIGEPYPSLLEYLHDLVRNFSLEGVPGNRQRWSKNMQPLLDQLSGREMEVLKLIAAGNSNQQIARTLVVAESTIKTHLNSIYSKLHVKSRLQALTKAHTAGLLL
jgi:LuxR family maltose regulon positive regulatory protein